MREGIMLAHYMDSTILIDDWFSACVWFKSTPTSMQLMQAVVFHVI
jgi:hypothetical protein